MSNTPKPLYVYWGEEFLVRQAADELVSKLVPPSERELSCIIMDGASAREVAQELSTLPLFPGTKVVLVRDPEFMAPKKRGDALGRAKDAWRAGRRKEGARRVLAVLGRAGVTALDIERSAGAAFERLQEELGLALGEADLTFLVEVAAFCREERIVAPDSDAGALVDLFRRGCPEGHALIIAATDVDAKNPLLKIAHELGTLGERKVSERLKDLDLSTVAQEALKPLGKRMESRALDRLKERCGANMRLVRSELEKLALYVDGPLIRADDVDLLVAKVREDEYLELSDALQRRDFVAALRYADAAMEQGTHPLPILGAVAGIVRTLLENHDRVSRLAGGAVPRSFEDFKSRVFPAIEEEARAQKVRVPHPYAAFAGMQAALRYSRNELYGALLACAEADLALKTSGGAGQLIIERLLHRLCVRSAA